MDTGSAGSAGGAALGSGRQLQLHLGVIQQPYRRGGLTTYDVAKILESRYGIMAAFYRVHQRDVHKALANSVEGALETLLMGRAINPWSGGMQAIQQDFRDFISSREAERVGIPGTPTKAALRGVNHRLAHPYRRGVRRPSFRDTGLYMTSMRAWVD